MTKENPKNNIFKKIFVNLRHKYKLVIINESTYEEKATFRLSRMNVLILYGLITIFSIVFTLAIIYVTPLKEYIPGYASVEKVEQVYINERNIDTLETKYRQIELYRNNIINRIIKGELSENDTLIGIVKEGVDYKNIPDVKSEQDSLLRKEWENSDNYDLVYTPSQSKKNSISRFVFFTPIHGPVINGFDRKNRHYGIDILSKKDLPVKAVLDGTVILASWTYENGHTITIQHDDELLSVYKHNSTLLKNQGDKVKAGEPIAIIGNTGKLSSGPHLHFELWYQRNPVNPAKFINFD